MKKEDRVCVVLYKTVDGNARYAVLKRKKNWEGWELVKGHVEGDAEEAAREEVEEEAGVEELLGLERIECDAGWDYEEDGETVEVDCECFTAEADEDAVVSVDGNPHDEHEEGYFLNFRDAHDILTHDNQRELLEKVHERIRART